MPIRLAVLILAGWFCSPGGAAEKTGTKAPAKATAKGSKTVKENVLERIAVIGASATAGFGTDLNLGQVLEAAILRKHQPIHHVSNILFYSQPRKTATAILEEALKSKPTLVVGADFLFWFGYGSSGASGKPIDSEKDRLDLLDEGLKLAGKFQCPLVLGDFSDMSSAQGMLQPKQIPTKETLAALNKRLGAWAKDKPNVIVLPLAKLIDDIHAGKPFKIGKNEWKDDQLGNLVQEDKLHPTVEGLVAIAFLVADEVVAGKTGALAKDFDLDPAGVLRKLVKGPAPSEAGETAAETGKDAAKAKAPKKKKSAN